MHMAQPQKTMNEEQLNNYIHNHSDPLSATHAGFDWESVYKTLDEEPDWQDDDLYEKLAQALRRVFEFCLDVDLTRKQATEQIGRRLLALAWVTNPALIPGSPSLIELSNRIGLSPYPLAIITSEVSKEFGIQNRAQAHAWNQGIKMKPHAHKAHTAGLGRPGQDSTRPTTSMPNNVL
jgi:hypothetical protein